jgi:predicted AAA+ superfamily ATPase
LKKEQEELGKIVMSKKQRRLYDQVDKGMQKKKDLARQLKEKAKKLATQEQKKSGKK